MSLTIYPIPFKMLEQKGYYLFSGDLNFYYSSRYENKEAFDLLNELWNNFTCTTGQLCFVETEKLEKNRIFIGKSLQTEFPELREDYILCVKPEGIYIEGIHFKDTLKAYFTLLQLIRLNEYEEGRGICELPLLEIYDKPALKFRGLHICIFPETSLFRLKRTLRLAALLKYSHVIIEFWGMLKYDCMKELSWKNAFSKQELIPIFQEACQLGLELIPMFNHMGHATQSRALSGRHVVLNQDPTKAALFEADGWSWCVSNEKTLRLLREIREELISLFPGSKYFHLGCDEAYSFGTCSKCRHKNPQQLFADYVNGICNELTAQGIQPIIWGDQLLRQGQWEAPYYANGTFDLSIVELLDKNIIIADWQYEVTDGTVKTSRYFTEKGFHTLVCPWNDNNNIIALARAAYRNGYFGFLATTWQDIENKITLIPTAACVSWNPEAKIGFHEIEGPIRSQFGNLMRKALSASNFKEYGWYDCEVK